MPQPLVPVLPSSSTSELGLSTIGSPDCDMSEKVQTALALFSRLRQHQDKVEVGDLDLSTTLTSTAQLNSPQTLLAEKANRQADKAMEAYSKDMEPRNLVYFGAASEKQLKTMTSRELIRKLAVSEAIIKRLHEKSKGLTRELEDIKLVQSHRGAEVSEDTLKALQSKHQKELKRKDEEVKALRDKQARLSALLQTLEERLQIMEAENHPPAAQASKKAKHREVEVRASGSTSSLQLSGAGTSGVPAAKEPEKDDVEALNARIHQLEVEKEVLSSYLFQSEKRVRELEEAAAVPQEPAAPVPPIASKRRRRKAGSSMYATVWEDAVTTLQFRLHQCAAEKQRLMKVQVKAVLESPSAPVAKVNEEVKILFSLMKQSMLSDWIQHEAERERLNETMYALEKEVSTVGL